MGKNNKETLWFKHDYDTAIDPKILSMLSNFGGVGYAMFWVIVEMLYTSPSNRLEMKKYTFQAIAKQMQAIANQNVPKLFQVQVCSEDVDFFIKSCIEDHELFKSEDGKFWSSRVDEEMEKRREISRKRSESGSEGGKSRKQIVANA
jgi:hypothetical protein